MLPVALLSFCGIMLGLGSSLSSQDVRELLPFLNHSFFILIFTWMSKIGTFAFSFLPLLFAIAIPLGLAREDKGVAAFSGFVGFIVLNLSINFYLTVNNRLPSSDPHGPASNDIQSVLGIPSINTGVLGAVFVGILVYFLHERFRAIRLPDAFAFFGGNRFVPIITTLIFGLIGLIIPLIWPFFATGIYGLGHLINSTGLFGPMIFGTGERLLLPIGLHHILVALIRLTDAGGTLNICGETISGALTIFQAELSCPTTTHFSQSATRFLSQGKMPSFLGGLPGAALAIYCCARPENRSKIKGLLISGIVACTVGGITEPLEFLFLFVAPALYIIHAFLTGIGFMLMPLIGVTIGNTDGNLIDLIVFGVLHGTATKWYWVPLIATIWFGLYFFIFRFIILRFDIKTPGRDIDHEKKNQRKPPFTKSGFNSRAILEGLGGTNNIISLDNCITRLRLSVKNSNLVNDTILQNHRAIGVVRLDETTIQVIFGPQVQLVKDELDELIKAQ